MQGSNGRRRSAARIIGWGLVALGYGTVLVWASGISADPAAAEATTTEVAGVLAAAPADVEAVLEVAAAPAVAAEERIVTLAMAGGVVVLAGLAYAIHTVHSRLARRARRRRESLARLVARQIATLM
jgi:hypothetical protein